MSNIPLSKILDSKKIYENADSLPKSISIQDVEEFLNLDKWTHNKRYKNLYKSLSTDTYSKYNLNDYWCMRYTSIPNIDEDTFRNKFVLYLNGYNNKDDEYIITQENASFRVDLEKEYIHTIQDIKITEEIVETDHVLVKFKNTYKLKPSILSLRKFHQWVYINKPIKAANEEISYVVSLRAKPDEEQKIKCYYVSIEMLKYNLNTKELKWYMATTSDAGGSIPMFLQKLGIDNAVVEDIPSFLGYIKY